MTSPGPGPLVLDHGPLRLHVVAIGGAGMNALATLLVAMGHQVSGSDLKASPVLDRLRGLGAEVWVGHDASHVGEVDAVVYSTAVDAGNPELEEARRRGIPTYNRSQLTEAVCRSRRVLAVSGTHGKTTTTAILAAILGAAGWGPGYLVGGELAGGHGGADWGTSEWLVVEADESDASFLHTNAFGALVTNIEPDHLDFYGEVEALEAAFMRFVESAPGPRVLCLDDPGSARLARGLARATTYGSKEGADARATDIDLGARSSDFTFRSGTLSRRLRLGVAGLHNVVNATGAVALALEAAGMDEAVLDAAAEALAGFEGVARRLQWRGEKDGVTFIDDYAHMPAEISATLAAVGHGGWGRVVAVFQPHRYSRTEAHWKEFGPAFAGADVVVITGIYPAGEAPRPGVSAGLVADAAQDALPGTVVEQAEGRPDLVRLLGRVLRPGDLCLSMGAGDITTLPDDVIGSLS